MCLEFPAQTRYIVAFPLICSHFMNCTHELCPEEVRGYHISYSLLTMYLKRHHIGDRSLTMVNGFLDEMAKEAKNIITTICDEQCLLSDKVTSSFDRKQFIANSFVSVVAKARCSTLGSNSDQEEKGQKEQNGSGR